MIDTQNQKVVVITPPAAIVNNASPATAEIDTLGFEYVDIYLALGATDIALTALKVQEYDVTGGAGAADVPGAVYGATGAPALPAATDDNKVFGFHIDMRGRKRFLDLVATVGNGVAGAYLYAWAVLSRPAATPKTAAGRGLAAELFVPQL